MIPYFVVFFFIITFAIADRYSKNNAWKVLMFFVFTIFAGLRYNVGVDYESYVDTFNEVDGKTIREPGGFFIVRLVKMIGGTEQLYFLLMALITQTFIYKTFLRNPKCFWLSTFVYYCISLFYLASFNMVRQYAAMSISLWALYYIEKGKAVRFFIVMLFAGFFVHLTVLIFIPLYYYIRKAHSMKTYIALVFISIGVSKSISLIASLTSYDIYNIAERDLKVNEAQYLFTVFSLIMLMIGHKFKYFFNNSLLYNMNSLCLYTLIVVILQTTGTFILICQRINNYFILAYLLIIPAVLSSLSKKNEAICKLFVYLFCVLYFIRTIAFNGDHYMLTPYDVNFKLFNF